MSASRPIHVGCRTGRRVFPLVTVPLAVASTVSVLPARPSTPPPSTEGDATSTPEKAQAGALCPVQPSWTATFDSSTVDPVEVDIAEVDAGTASTTGMLSAIPAGEGRLYHGHSGMPMPEAHATLVPTTACTSVGNDGKRKAGEDEAGHYEGLLHMRRPPPTCPPLHSASPQALLAAAENDAASCNSTLLDIERALSMLPTQLGWGSEVACSTPLLEVASKLATGHGYDDSAAQLQEVLDAHQRSTSEHVLPSLQGYLRIFMVPSSSSSCDVSSSSSCDVRRRVATLLLSAASRLVTLMSRLPDHMSGDWCMLSTANLHVQCNGSINWHAACMWSLQPHNLCTSSITGAEAASRQVPDAQLLKVTRTRTRTRTPTRT
jgi:hypothetical protein